LRRDTERGRSDVLDEYGATNPAEFFAVATECFFEKPIPLRRKHPQLYEELKAYYRQDPASLSLLDGSVVRGADCLMIRAAKIHWEAVD
jgi:Mlc titration factor MtfA (ptsG expression regulator)